jgi:Lipid A 3-O-deacylase (PagL)
LRFNCLCGLTALCLLAPQLAHSQETETAVETNSPSETQIEVMKNTPLRKPVVSEISVMGMIPDGNFTMFSATLRCHAWAAGVEYDRHSWGHFLKSQVDYAVEVIPFALLSQPAKSDFWGNAISPNQELVPGVAVLPFGFRFLWRSGKAIKPYMVGKIGAIAFTKKAFSPNASYANFNIQAASGVQIKLTERVDLRVDPFEFFHVSNGYFPKSNPGMDELAMQVGMTYHLGKHVE